MSRHLRVRSRHFSLIQMPVSFPTVTYLTDVSAVGPLFARTTSNPMSGMKTRSGHLWF
ncbi:hypothetical protein FHV99_002537 [Ochrobactrum sp. P20RRXII]|nr:hypothetical protein [Ochrobactrum sp. P20RRXII]